MKTIISFFLGLVMLNVQATEGKTYSEENKTGEELLAEVSQPAEDPTHIKVVVMKNQTIEEYRQKGELILVKVIPNDGKPYYIDPMEKDKLKESGREIINSGVKPVRWVLKEF
ncbi:MAG: DUF2782 domain-containing protein [Marinicella sp.]|nr:DUF2782 domain-containing protein [Xanthomonadales bacterium]